jgi:hypothetical protein
MTNLVDPVGIKIKENLAYAVDIWSRILEKGCRVGMPSPVQLPTWSSHEAIWRHVHRH